MEIEIWEFLDFWIFRILEFQNFQNKARVTVRMTVTMMIITPPFKPRHDDDSDGDEDDDVSWNKIIKNEIT